MRSLMAVLVLAGVLAGAAVSSKPEPPSVPHSTLDDAFVQLRDDFNAGAGNVRLVFVVDSSCAMCLKGLADIDDALLRGTTDPRLETFVVHVPVIGGAEEHIGPAATLLHNERVKHYWNSSGEFGRRLSSVAGLSNGDKFVYAWDVWLIYGPDAHWEGRDPPKPDVLMHQLPGLRGRSEFPRLDAKVFAREVHARLAQLPKDTAGQSP